MRLQRTIVWILLIGLIVEIGAEAWSRHCFHKTLTALIVAMRAERLAGRELADTDSFKLVSGWPSSSQTESRRGIQTEYRWHSFFWDLRIQLQSDASGAIGNVTIGSGGMPLLELPEQVIATRPASASALAEQRPVRGFSTVSPRAIAMEQRANSISLDFIERERLIGEIVRQALLNTARDAGFLQTRDAALGDLLPDEENAAFPLIAAVTSIDAQRRVQIHIERRHSDGTATLVVLLQFQLSPEPLIESLVAKMDAMTTNELQLVLIRAGFERPAHQYSDNGTAPEAISSNLGEFEVLSQFAAVRALHSEIFQKGETIPRLAALSSGYAHLAALCRFLVGPAADVFAARGLLYAERLRRLTLGGPFAHWNRGYVRALVGLHASALEDTARAAAEAEAKGSPPPGWRAAVEAYCRHDLEELSIQSKQPGITKLPQFLRLLAAAHSEAPDARREPAVLMLSSQPDCELAFDLAVDNVSDEVQSQLSIQAVERFSVKLRDFLRSNVDIPVAIRERAEGAPGNLESEMRFDAQVIGELRQASSIDLDGGEPSLAVLAHLIQEISFAQTCRLLYREKFPPSAAAVLP